MNRKFLLPIGVAGTLLLIFGVMAVPKKPTISNLDQGEVKGVEIRNTGKINISLKVDFGEEKESSPSGLEVKKGSTALSVLKDNYEVKTKKYSFGEMVQAIDAVANGAGKFWIYYIDGEVGKVGADQYRLEEGDRVEWRLENEK